MKRPLNEEGDLGDGVSKSRKKSKDVHRDFSSQEISKLKETEALYHSSLFRLQVSELLREVSVKQKMKARLDEVSTFISEKLKKLPSGKEHKITDRAWLTAKEIKIPIEDKPMEVKGSFQFVPPVDVYSAGSYVLETMVMPDIHADLILVMPKTFFQPKDFLNQRYTRKRALYLCVVAAHLRKVKRVKERKFTYLAGNPHKPVLLVTAAGEDGKNVNLSLQAVPEQGAFKESRFHVSKNNIRPNWFSGNTAASEENTETENLPSTPFYNSSVQHDLCLSTNEKFLEKILAGSEGVRDGIKLLKVWMHQRELLKGSGAFSSFLISCFVATLIMSRKVNKMMNYYQVFRTTLLYLSKSDWVSEPPSLYEDPPQKIQPTVDEFREAGTCVFVDRTGFYNLAFGLQVSTFLRAKQEAHISIETLEQQRQSTFDALFMTTVSFARKFDHVFHITLDSECLHQCVANISGLQTQVMDHGGAATVPLTGHVTKVLLQALGKRAVLVQPNIGSVGMWDASEDPLDIDSNLRVAFGISIDPTNAFNILDKGPSAEMVESREFREFWGERSEMRRFKDGTIHEAVLWTDSTSQSERRLVCQKIVKHILQRHCHIPSKQVDYMEGRLDPLLYINLTSADTRNNDYSLEYGTGEENSLAVHRAFDVVSRAVRSLTSLPLSIHSIQGTHPVFRHASVFPPLSVPAPTGEEEMLAGHIVPKEGLALPNHVPAIEVICLLEGSGKWPEDIEAIKAMKTLLHIKMGRELKDSHQLPVSINKEYVDIVKEGFVFRLVIANTRELAVLRTVKTESGMVKFKDTEKSLALEKKIVHLPRLTHLLHGVQQEHPVFSVTVRLCKRWVAAQLLWGLITEEAVELIVAHLFISPHPFTPPGSPNAGFLRFLHFLCSFNWRADPLIVNLNKEFTDEDLSTIPKEFERNRSSLPCMCICTPTDKEGSRWTKTLPTEPFLKRLIVLARHSATVLEAQILKSTDVTDFKMVFRPPLAHFDLIITILKKANVLHHQGVDSKNNFCVDKLDTGSARQRDAFPVVDFCVLNRYLQDLQSTFGDFSMFFHDPLGGGVIGMVWKSQAFERKDFKAGNFPHRKPEVDEEEKTGLVALKESILEDIRVMGGGIVESIAPPSEKMS